MSDQSNRRKGRREEGRKGMGFFGPVWRYGLAWWGNHDNRTTRQFDHTGMLGLCSLSAFHSIRTLILGIVLPTFSDLSS